MIFSKGAAAVITEKKEPQNSDVDSFWDLSGLVEKPKPKAPAGTVSNTSSHEISIDGHELKTEPIPPRSQVKKPEIQQGKVIEYDGTGAICHVKITSWPTKYTFYSSFVARAESLWRKKHAPCDPVGFFSYMPQYENMTIGQLAYYLYWRSLVRHGNYPPVDASYIILYLYEVINLPHMIGRETGAIMIALVWAAYREKYPYLDKYAGEWLCDYCLIYKVKPPLKIIAPFIADAAKNLSFPEMFMSANPSEEGAEFFVSCASYDYKKSKYYAANKAVFDEHIPAAALIGAKKFFSSSIYESLPAVRHTRDSFAGAIAGYPIKYKMEILYRSVSFNRTVKEALGSIVSLCENNVRAHLGIKSRFSKISLPDETVNAVNEYFDAVFPDRYKKKKHREDDEEYLKYYDSDSSGTASIENALKIENDAWQTALELDSENIEIEDARQKPEEAEVHEPLEDSDDDVYFALVKSLDAPFLAILCAALDGRFSEECKRRSVLPMEAERIINEKAYDITGDSVVENGEIIPDYYEELKAASSAEK